MAPAGLVDDYHRFFVESNIPVVLVDRKVPGAPVDAVIVDNFGGARQVVNYLIRLGHRRIAAITGRQSISTTCDRIDGYRRALEDAGISADPDLLISGNSRLEGGYQAGLTLLQLPQRPTAIFATNNLMAIGLMRATVDLGLRCPEDLSVACFDDFEWASVFHPRLTTVAQPTYVMGAKAIELLFARFDGTLTGDPREVVLSPSLIIRDSCTALHLEPA
jgi:LacI family transcriptional regulator